MVDDTTTLDLDAYEPAIALGEYGQKLWDQIAADAPFWWTQDDLPMANILCAATDSLGDAFDSGSFNERAQMMHQWRLMAGELGLSPTARGRLKLTEAQGVAAAKKIEQMQADNERRTTQAVDLDDLISE